MKVTLERKVSLEIRVNGNGSKEMGRIGLLCHGSNLHRFGIGSNGLGSTLKNAKFKGDNILISTQVQSTQFNLSQFDLSYSTKRVDLIIFDLFHSTHFMQSSRFDRTSLVRNYLVRRKKHDGGLPLIAAGTILRHLTAKRVG